MRKPLTARSLPPKQNQPPLTPPQTYQRTPLQQSRPKLKPLRQLRVTTLFHGNKQRQTLRPPVRQTKRDIAQLNQK
jgi:hypothetical protein